MSLEHPFLGHFAAWDSSAKHLHPQPQMSFPVALARPRVGLLAFVTSEVHTLKTQLQYACHQSNRQLVVEAKTMV